MLAILPRASRSMPPVVPRLVEVSVFNLIRFTFSCSSRDPKWIRDLAFDFAADGSTLSIFRCRKGGQAVTEFGQIGNLRARTHTRLA